MNFKFKKKFGQNFLIDKNILNKITSSVSPSEDDLIIEIGPGSGNLTRELQKYDSNLLAYEIDLETKPYIEPLTNNKTKIIYSDFLDRDINEDIKNIKYKNIYIIANIPYYITTPIIEKIIKEKLNIRKMVLMMQKEVADRLTSSPKSRDYGYITVYLNYYFNIKKVTNVGRNAFRPIPNVDSMVLEFVPCKRYLCKNEELFFQLIKDAFQFKRKNLNNNLSKYDKNHINNILSKYDLSLTSRAEEIPIEIFVEIANNL